MSENLLQLISIRPTPLDPSGPRVGFLFFRRFMSENLYTTDGGTWPWPRYEDYSQVPPESQEEEEEEADDV